MTHDQMMQALSPVRLPGSMATLSLPEMAALLAFGILAGLAVAAAVLPLTRRRAPRRRIRLADLRALPVPQRMLALARHLGHLPEALRAAAYGAAPPPSDRRIERLARRARLRRMWRR
ncbi:hypothetical protein E4191_09485 [Paracoccus liaowanqingii]|uniref:Uncharacterized protein n=1 Tax=Paracoccus liaowanqingii TaxID=2560053 RepID=A0A4P7HNI0_9RHOB|nr:hypothetical protein [Paracoccus liaowanqingii]QBX34917.1 hypothetical protein E4191_09485 [Paracoccus liaowanqingii]